MLNEQLKKEIKTAIVYQQVSMCEYHQDLDIRRLDILDDQELVDELELVMDDEDLEQGELYLRAKLAMEE